MRTRSRGDLPAFPMSAHASDLIDDTGLLAEDGMSYKQWLVAHIAAGLAANADVSASRVVDLAFQLSDEIVERFDSTDHQYD
jgi:hypothetical protein